MRGGAYTFWYALATMFAQLPRDNVFLTDHGTSHIAESHQVNSIFLKKEIEKRVPLGALKV